MLGFLQGKIVSLHPDSLECVVLSGEVGYEIIVPRKTIETLVPNQFVTLWIHTHVREDALVLYGFSNELEKKFFRLLLHVQGFGPKAALALLSEHGVDRLTHLILEKNAGEISNAPGIGKKLAERLVLELGGKIEKLTWLVDIKKNPTHVKPQSMDRQLRDDLSSALTHLGYAPNQIKNGLDKLFEKKEVEKEGFENLLRTMLKDMSGRSVHG